MYIYIERESPQWERSIPRQLNTKVIRGVWNVHNFCETCTTSCKGGQLLWIRWQVLKHCKELLIRLYPYIYIYIYSIYIYTIYILYIYIHYIYTIYILYIYYIYTIYILYIYTLYIYTIYILYIYTIYIHYIYLYTIYIYTLYILILYIYHQSNIYIYTYMFQNIHDKNTFRQLHTTAPWPVGRSTFLGVQSVSERFLGPWKLLQG